MSMSRKDFIRFADHIKDAIAEGEPFTERQMLHVINFCREQNPKFNRQIFWDYIAGKCGPCGGRLR